MARYRFLDDVELPPILCTPDHFSDVLAAPEHHLLTGYRGRFVTTGTLPTGLDGTVKSVFNASASAFQLARIVDVAATGATNTLTLVAHGLLDDQPLHAKDDALVHGLSPTATYYVRDKTADTFKLSLSVGGSVQNLAGDSTGSFVLNTPIDFTSNGSGVLSFIRALTAVLDTVTGAQVTEDPFSAAWLDYVAWKQLSNASDAVVRVSISDARLQAIAETNRLAGLQRARWMDIGPGTSLWWAERLNEARLANVDGSITGGEYPLLEAEIGLNGANVAAVATNVLSQWATLRTKLAGIETARATAVATIGSTSLLSALAAIPPAIVWP